MGVQGQCLCGAVTFEAESVDPHVHACHCSMCRGWTGGPMLAATANGVTFGGAEHIKRYQSSEWAERGFCAECGGTLFYHLQGPDMYMIATGCFADQEQFALQGEIYIDEKPPGYNFAGEHPRMTGEEFLASIGMGDTP